MNDTWTHKLARGAVRPLIGSGVTPNHLTTLRLLTGVGACAALAMGPQALGGHAFLWGGVLWVLSAFLDRADGELARIGNMMSPGGHRYDYLVDNGVNCLFFLAIGVGLRDATLHGFRLGGWAVALGVIASAAMFACNWMSERYEARVPGERTWNGAWGFHADDALYLLGPAAWFGLLMPILFGAAVGTSAMALVILVRLLRLPPDGAAAAASRHASTHASSPASSHASGA
ncbi:CDP-alcohol phosphatidyltransferase family protein [Rhizosaccharibacter radicis]|uniref:CDP-alcohol phosphatidyltransferase family protein n=1 Tax=Rhizosaccharibacter radicis TaxID=2782605 RepID=A0ABT1W0H7_9PROT|nr:CDP-alcohol phosphatidyltransferase family protein [Acetobacteraceae bacterium KSS12]